MLASPVAASSMMMAPAKAIDEEEKKGDVVIPAAIEEEKKDSSLVPRKVDTLGSRYFDIDGRFIQSVSDVDEVDLVR